MLITRGAASVREGAASEGEAKVNGLTITCVHALGKSASEDAELGSFPGAEGEGH